MSGRGWATLAALGAVLALAGGEGAAILLQHRATPAEADWRRAAEQVRALRAAATEPLLFAPAWVEPVGRTILGPQLTLAMASLSHVESFARVWQVSVRGGVHPWLRGLRPERTWTFGRVTVALYRQRPVRVLYDFRRNLRAARVRLEGPEGRPCPWRDGRFRCSRRAGWNWVGPHLAEVGHRPYACIYAHPRDAHRLVIRFPGVPLGRKLVLFTGIDDFENRKRAHGPVRLEVAAGGRTLGAVEHRSDWPWHRTTLDSSALAGRRAAVTFTVTTPLAYARAFCFAAEARAE